MPAFQAKAHAYREDEIVRLATTLLIKEGYLGFTLDKLAALVGIAKGTLYLHFPSKEDLILAIVERSIAERSKLFERAATFEGRPRERMAAIGMADGIFVALYPQHFQIEQILQHIPLWNKTSPERREHVGISTRGCMKAVLGIIQDAVAAGDLDLKGAPPETLGFGLWSMSHGVHLLEVNPEHLRSVGITDPKSVLRLHQNRLLDGWGWKPLFDEWDYEATSQRIAQQIFPEELKKLGVVL